MDTHVRKLSELNILFGVISLLVAGLLLAIYDGPVGLYHSMDDSILSALIAGSAVFHLLLAIPCIAGGYHLRSFTEWSRGLVIVTSALNILNIPFGSLLGCYGLWVLFTLETDPLFAARTRPPANNPGNPPTGRSAKREQQSPSEPARRTSTILSSPGS